MNEQEFIESLTPKKIYYISDPRIANGVRHYRVCVKTDAGILTILSCCTTQYDNNINHIKKTREHYDTLVSIDHETSENNLNELTYVNCNGYEDYTENELRVLFRRRAIEDGGMISDFEYKKILEGFLLSRRIEGEFKQEVKEILKTL